MDRIQKHKESMLRRAGVPEELRGEVVRLFGFPPFSCPQKRFWLAAVRLWLVGREE